LARTRNRSLLQLAFDSWLFMGEAAMVIWLRSLKLMMGGPRAGTEARRMVMEKVAAQWTLLPVLASASPATLASRALGHYEKPVRANRRRLARRQ